LFQFSEAETELEVITVSWCRHSNAAMITFHCWKMPTLSKLLLKTTAICRVSFAI